MEYQYCKERIGTVCNLTSLIAGREVEVTPQDCAACQRFDNTHNEVTKALATVANPSLSTPERGVGTRLANTIEWFLTKPPGCHCADRAEIMNMWGPDRCKQEMKTILSWLRESALDNDIPYSEFVCHALVRSVIAISSKLDY